MPTPAYLTIKGKSQGLISAGALSEDSVGKLYQAAHADEILVHAFSHQIIVPREPQSGEPTGMRIHKPLTITKAFDKSSPLIYQALTTGEELDLCHLVFCRTSGAVSVPFFHIKLMEARIVDVQSKMPTCLDEDMAHYTTLEDVSFTYKQIIWSHVDGATSSSDTWGASQEG